MKWSRAALFVTAVVGSAAAVQQGLTVRDRTRYPAPGLLVHVDGHQMHLQVRGLIPLGRLSCSRRVWARSRRTGTGSRPSLLQRSEALPTTVRGLIGAGS